MALNNPLVSVIMPAYNASAYVLDSVNSVLKQSYSNWELLVVDDGSTDDTAMLVSSVCDERVRLISRVNAGVAAARNTGLSHAKGELIAFLDSDDLWCPDKLLTQVEYFESHPALVLLHSSYTSFTDCGKNILNKQLEPFKIESIKSRLLVFNFIATLTVVVRASDLRMIGGFDEGLFGPEDWDLWIRLSSRGDIGYIPLPLAKYREHTGGISKNRHRQLSQEYHVIKRHAFVSSLNVARKALWFHKLKLLNYYFKNGFFAKAVLTYFVLLVLSPLNYRNISYPLTKVLGR